MLKYLQNYCTRLGPIRLEVLEKILIKEKPDATTLVVKRGFDRTLKVEHLEQARVNKLTTADDNLIDIGDDFGFSDTSSIFTDSLQFNPATRTDS